MNDKGETDRRVVSGFKLPSDSSITDNERASIEVLRIMFDDAIPEVSLKAVSLLRKWAVPG